MTEVKVQEGQRVGLGQLLISIDDKDSAQQVRAAEKTVEAAAQSKALTETTAKRFRQLYDQKALTAQEMDQIETQNKVADAEYERAKAGLAEAEVHRAIPDSLLRRPAS